MTGSHLLGKELNKGYLVGPFNFPPFSAFCTSPVGMATRKQSLKKRSIFDLSDPHSGLVLSVNSYILSFPYFYYATVDDTIKLIKLYPVLIFRFFRVIVIVTPANTPLQCCTRQGTTSWLTILDQKRSRHFLTKDLQFSFSSYFCIILRLSKHVLHKTICAFITSCADVCHFKPQ